MQGQENARIRYNILIVDPDAEFADLVAQAISDVEGTYSVTVDTDAQEAVAHVREAQIAQRQFDLLIADVRTPGSGSVRMLEELAQSYPEIKIITMTAYHSPELAARVQQLDVHTYLVKPVAPSRFRRLVQDALAAEGPDASPALSLSALSSAQQEAVERQLANLRRTTGSGAALLVHTSGEIRAMDCLEPDLNLGTLCVTLMDAQRTIAQALAQMVQTQTPIRQSYYGTESYSICIHRLDDAHAVATIFDSTVREGQMWYYIREGIDALQAALATEVQQSPPRRRRPSSDGVDMVERYFAERPTTRTRPRRDSHDRATTPPNQPPAPKAQPVAETPAPQASATYENTTDQDQGSRDPDVDQLALPERLEMKRLLIDEIDWDLSGNQDWDTLVTDADQTFLGMSFEEAKQRGLLDDLEVDQ